MAAVVGQPERLFEEDVIRARVYGLLGSLLGNAPNAGFLAELRSLTGDDTPFGREIAAIGAAARATHDVDAEYHALFIGLTGGEVVPYASYYLSGFLYEKPLAELRTDLWRLGIAAAEGVAEPEDHLASLFEVMQGLILGSFGPAADSLSQKMFFDAHIGPWAGRFFADLETAPAAVFYRPVARAGSLFVAIEKEAFSML